MKKNRGRTGKENLVTSLEIPRDLAMKETVFTVTGTTSGSSLQLSKCFAVSEGGNHMY